MYSIKINTIKGKSLLITGGTIKDISGMVPGSNVFIITDTNVSTLYGEFFPRGKVLSIAPGEQSKTLSVVQELCRSLLESGADRSSFILGFGGGVVCDIAGMVASLYMRGVRHAFVSTSLLSQVDASVGGKNGVNLGVYKNMIGTFKQPEFVLCDQSMLATLSDAEYLSGMGELLKHAVIDNRSLFFTIADNLDRLLDRDTKFLEEVIYRSVRVKARIVRSDFLERGKRRLLNFGHTFGHPLEMTESIPHGIAVMKGMVIASELSVARGEMPVSESRFLTQVLDHLGVYVDKPLPGNITELISKDKKATTGFVNAVLLRSIGKAVVRKISLAEIEEFVKDRNVHRS